jgi:hypothetical protein
MPDTLCLYSHLKNTSGAERHFGWLPPHGKTLTANQTITVFGDIFDQLMTGGRLNERKRDGLLNDLSNNYIEIIKSPVVFFYDATDTRVSTIEIDNGAVGVVDPCYGSYVGSA